MPIPLPPNKLPSIKPFTSNSKETLKVLVSDIRWKQLDENKKLEAINQAMPSMQNEDLETQKAFKNKLEQEFLKEQQKPKSYGVSGKWEEEKPYKSSLWEKINQPVKLIAGQEIGERIGTLVPVPPVVKPIAKFVGGTLGFALTKALEKPKPEEVGKTYPEAIYKGFGKGLSALKEGAQAELTAMGLGKVLGKGSEKLRQWSKKITGEPEIVQALINIYEKTGVKIPLAKAEKYLKEWSRMIYSLTSQFLTYPLKSINKAKYKAMETAYFKWISDAFEIPIDNAKELGDKFIKEFSDLELGKKYISAISEKLKVSVKLVNEAFLKPQALFNLKKTFTVKPGDYPEAIKLKTILEPYAKVGFTDTTTKQIYDFLNKIIGQEKISLTKVLAKYGEPFEKTSKELPEFTFNEINTLLKNIRQKFAPALKTSYGMGDLAEGQAKRFESFVKKVQDDSLKFLENYYSKIEPNQEILKAITDFKNANKLYKVYRETYKDTKIIAAALKEEAPQEATKLVETALAKPENIGLLKSASPQALKIAKQYVIKDILLKKTFGNKIDFLSNINNLINRFDEHSINLLLGKDSVKTLTSFKKLLNEDLTMKNIIANTIANNRGYQNVLYAMIIGAGGGYIKGGIPDAIASGAIAGSLWVGLPSLLKTSMQHPDKARHIINALFTKIDDIEAKPIYNILIKELKSIAPKTLFPTYEQTLKNLQQQPKGKSLLQTLQAKGKSLLQTLQETNKQK